MSTLVIFKFPCYQTEQDPSVIFVSDLNHDNQQNVTHLVVVGGLLVYPWLVR